MEALEVVLEDPRHEIKSYGFTSFRWHELPFHKSNTTELKLLLDDTIELSDYGKGVEKVYFVFIIYPKSMESSIRREEEHEFLADEKAVCIAYRTDYERLMAAKDEEALPILKATYLKGLKEILPIMAVADFDWQRFCEDLEGVLFEG